MKSSGPGFFFFRFYLEDTILQISISFFIPFHLQCALVTWELQEFCSFCLTCQLYWYKVFFWHSFIIFNTSKLCSGVTALFTIAVLCVFSHFNWRFWGFKIFFTKNYLLVSFLFLCCFCFLLHFFPLCYYFLSSAYFTFHLLLYFQFLRQDSEVIVLRLFFFSNKVLRAINLPQKSILVTYCKCLVCCIFIFIKFKVLCNFHFDSYFYLLIDI